MSENEISSVLFVCSMNMVRSPMAATIARGYYKHRLFVRSAGVERGTEDPMVRRVLEELNLDAPFSEPKDLSALADSYFDLVIVLSAEAQHFIDRWSADKSLNVEYWPTNDPTLATGNQSQKLDAYRAVRDDLRRKIIERLGPVD
jgi:protein-tyrosine-phosphatase